MTESHVWAVVFKYTGQPAPEVDSLWGTEAHAEERARELGSDWGVIGWDVKGVSDENGTRVTIMFSTPEKAESFRKEMERGGVIRWDVYDDDAYDYLSYLGKDGAWH